MKKTKEISISEILAALIVERDLPLCIVRIIGEVISLDAHSPDCDGVRTKCSNLSEVGKNLDVLDSLLQQTQSAVSQFCEHEEIPVFLGSLSEIRNSLVNLLA